MREGMSMRERVDSGIGMLYMFGLLGLVTWWWHAHTSSPSLWWSISLLGMIAGGLGVLRATQLILSGFSGFGRNFHEERDPEGPGGSKSSDDGDDSRESEAAQVIAAPTVLVISGGVAVLLRVFPSWNSVPEFEGDHWVSPRLLVPWMFVAGAVLVAWSVLLLVMMKTGPDRWTYAPDTRPEIRKWAWIYIAIGTVLILIAAAYTNST